MDQPEVPEIIHIKLAKLMAINYYLTELKKLNLVTPSIGKSYPVNPTNEESMIIHKTYKWSKTCEL